MVTNQLAAQGVTFQNAHYGSAEYGFSVFTSHALYNLTAFQTLLPSLTIQFNDVVNGAALNIVTAPGADAVLQAFLGATKVSEFIGDTDNGGASKFWGFENFSFDRIVLTTTNPANLNLGIDNLQIATNTVVPEPSTIALTIAGLSALAGVQYRRRKR